MKHVHKPYSKLSFCDVEGCKCGWYRVIHEGSFEFTEWTYPPYFRAKGPFREWLRSNSVARG